MSDLKSVGPNTAVPVRFRPRAPSEYSNRDFSNHFIEVVFYCLFILSFNAVNKLVAVYVMK